MYRYAGNFGKIERISLSCYTTFAPMTRQSGGMLVVQAPVRSQNCLCFINTQTQRSC
jgi:hypothetical protein